MPRAHDIAARIQNAFRARLSQVAVPHTTQNLAILNILLQSGFISSLTRGTVAGPSPGAFLTCSGKLESKRRIWADLKYRDDRPVLTNMAAISKPSNRIYMDVDEIKRICTGRRAAWIVRPLQMGEVAVVRTRSKENRFLEAREAVRLGLGGEVLCRAR
jgi:ribosomal protein S8